MYWLFCLFGPLYYFSHAQTRCYMSTYWLVCLVLMRCLLLLIRCVCICGVSLSIWLYHPTAREEELTAGLLGVTVQRFL